MLRFNHILRNGAAVWDQVKSDPDWYKDRTHRMLLTGELIRSALRDTKTPSCATPYLTGDLRLVYPVNLLAYMWLTFARVVSGEIEERPCEMFDGCHKHIYVGSGPGLK
jgi:hypothetical protein